MDFKAKLRRVFDRASTMEGSKPFEGQYRYIPRGFGLPNQSGWGVWDQREQRYLKDREVKRMGLPQLDERWTA